MHRLRRSSSLHALLGLALLLVTAATVVVGCDRDADGGAGTNEENFKFIRSREHLFRVDTTSGQVWRTPITGDGGWQLHGSAPAPDGPATAGRYQINNLGQRPGTIGPRSSLGLLRTDSVAGRAWLASEDSGAEWIPIEMPAGGETTRTAPPVPAPTPGPTANAPAPTTPPQDELQIPDVPTERADVSPEQAQADVLVLVQALNKEGLPVSVKAWSALQLGRYDAAISVPPLLEALKSDEPEVVVAAIKALKNTGSASTIPSILKLKQHPDPRVRAAVDEVVVEVR